VHGIKVEALSIGGVRKSQDTRRQPRSFSTVRTRLSPRVPATPGPAPQNLGGRSARRSQACYRVFYHHFESFQVSLHYPCRPMHEYDVALKNILTRPGSSVLTQLTGASSLKWINVEAP